MDYKVKYFDYPLQFKAHEKEYLRIIKETLSRGAFILGEELSRFEENLARFAGTKYAVGVGNCTEALLLAYYIAGIGPGDEVISVSHTFVATIETIRFLRAKPVLVDIADDHNMDAGLIESAITPKTKAIVPVHLNGRICGHMDKLMGIAQKHNLTVIEDAAQSLGATYRGQGAGGFGLAGCFSFYPAKLLGAFGDAGAVVTNDGEIAEKLRAARNHGRGRGSEISLWGLNCRMDNLQAAILDYKLTHLTAWITRRREIASIYNAGLSGIKELRLPSPPEDAGEHYDVFQNYEIMAERRDELIAYLNRQGIEVMLPWGGKGVHQHAALGFDAVKLPRTEELFSKALMLPMYPELSDSQVETVIGAVNNFFTVSLRAERSNPGVEIASAHPASQ